jgi:triacylglycerol lipase
VSTLAFDISQTGFSLVNALACAHASHLAYRKDPEVGQTAAEWGFDRSKAISCGTDDLIVLGNREMILVAFRGTDSFNDFRTNINVLYKKSALGMVHRGFMRAVVALWPELISVIHEARDNDQRLWFTGHSLGGALAVLASIKAQFEDGLPVGGLYTFGQPPIGTTGFCMEFEKRCPYRLYRIINHTDAVSTMPMLTLLEHVGDVRYFDLEGKMWDGEPPFRVSLSDHVNAPRVHGGMSDFKAHSIKGYIDLLTAHLSQQS